MKEKIVEEIYNILNKEVEPTDIIVEKPKDRKLGDYSIPCFMLLVLALSFAVLGFLASRAASRFILALSK